VTTSPAAPGAPAASSVEETDEDEVAARDSQAVEDSRAAEIAAHAVAAKRIRRPRDMVLSLAVLLVPILLLVLAGRFLYGDSTTATVDPQLALQGATRASMQPIPPGTAPADWKIVSARFSDGVLRIGYIDRSDRGVQLVQSRSADMVATELGWDARRVGEVSAAGQTWSQWAGRDGITALIRTEGPTTILLVGSVGVDELTRLATTVTQ
jgi:YD repeat-containing protein